MEATLSLRTANGVWPLPWFRLASLQVEQAELGSSTLIIRPVSARCVLFRPWSGEASPPESRSTASSSRCCCCAGRAPTRWLRWFVAAGWSGLSRLTDIGCRHDRESARRAAAEYAARARYPRRDHVRASRDGGRPRRLRASADRRVRRRCLTGQRGSRSVCRFAKWLGRCRGFCGFPSAVLWVRVDYRPVRCFVASRKRRSWVIWTTCWLVAGADDQRRRAFGSDYGRVRDNIRASCRCRDCHRIPVDTGARDLPLSNSGENSRPSGTSGGVGNVRAPWRRHQWNRLTRESPGGDRTRPIDFFMVG